MMKIKAHPSIVLSLLFNASVLVAGESVQIDKQEDGEVRVAAEKYAATISAEGLLTLSVDDTMVLKGGFGEWPERKWQLWPDADKPTVNVYANLVAVRSGEQRVEYTFGPASIAVESEGYSLLCTYNPEMVKAASGPKGTGGVLGPRVGYPYMTGLLLDNGSMIEFSMPVHVGYHLTPRLIPSGYLNGSVGKGELLKFTMTFQDVSMAAGIGGIGIEGIDSSYGDLNADGSTGYALVHFPNPQAVVLQTSQTNSGAQDTHEITYRATVKDHYFEGATVSDQTQTAVLKAGEEQALRWQLPTLAPGFYYLTVSATMDGKELTRTEKVFAVDLSDYRPKLTRPPDFKEFWEQKMAAMRARPFNEKLTEITEETVFGRQTYTPTPERKVYRIEFDGPDGERVTGMLQAPTAKGPHLGSMCPWRDGVTLDVPFPEEATFRRWDSKDDNNLLECILLNRRCFDYLKSRSDVDRLFLFGGSRGGPINWITAALDPEKIAGLSIHVPTSFGCSWMDKKYTGWGGKPDKMSWEEYTAMAAYVDPVNHAPDMIVPFINAYGNRDTLAQPQGIEAAFQLSPSKWKRISRDDGGHTRTAGFKKLQKQFAEFLETAPPMHGDLDILKQH